MESVDNLGDNVKRIQRDCLAGRLRPIEAVEEIDRIIGGITRVDYKAGIKLKFTNHSEMYALDVRGVPKKLYEVLSALAVLGYRKAQDNGSQFPGELHISRDASTKHHTGGIERIARRYAA